MASQPAARPYASSSAKKSAARYVIDAPGGGGKVPINPDYVLSRNADRVVIRNYEGKIFEYTEARDGTPLSPAPERIEEPDLV